MTPMRHHYAIEAIVGPEHLFRALKDACADTRLRGGKPELEFDWMKRRVALKANSREMLALAGELFVKRLERLGAPPDAVLAGKVEEAGGTFVQPYGVLMNPPEVFVELICGMLVELGCTTLLIEPGGTKFSFSIGAISKAVDHERMVEQFPLPDYVALQDLGRTKPGE